ncbi:hypothetical protein [Pseudopedobacter beijingensis]|uniref:DUF5723 domain-containing protein n=1 Tax=Pseudopedobacter beijingensis TaxID=1207056 RepID=A0ABW4IHM0_9SPHI
MGRLKDNITVNFIAPSFSTRYMSNNENHAFLFDIAIGYLDYNNKATLINKYLMTGKTLGAAFGFGYDYKLSKKLSVGAQLTYLGGTLTSMTVGGLIRKN